MPSILSKVAFDVASIIDTTTLNNTTWKHVHTMSIIIFYKSITNDSDNLILLSYDGVHVHDAIIPNNIHVIPLPTLSGYASFLFPAGTKVYMKLSEPNPAAGLCIISGYGQAIG